MFARRPDTGLRGVLEELTSGNGSRLYVLLDAARSEEVLRLALADGVDSCALFDGPILAQHLAVSPFLVRLETDSQLCQWLVDEGWGDSCSVLISSAAGWDELVEHFRKLLWIELESGKELLFRFYDPRVLRVYLPTCTAEEISRVLGPVDGLWLESPAADEVLELVKPPLPGGGGAGGREAGRLVIRQSQVAALEAEARSDTEARTP